MKNIDFKLFTDEERYPVRNVGTGMSQEEYNDLCKIGRKLKTMEAQMFIESEYGFIGSRVLVLDLVNDFYSDDPEEMKCRRIYKGNHFLRPPVFASKTRNYIRFNAGGYSYEVINGNLRFYIE